MSKVSLVNRIWSPWFFGLVAFFAVLIFIRANFDVEPRCHSGWKSPSIGRSGACSHHGGVDGSRGFISFLISFGCAVLAGVVSKPRIAEAAIKTAPSNKSTGHASARAQTKHVTADQPAFAPDYVPECPLHGRMIDADQSWVCGKNARCSYRFSKSDIPLSSCKIGKLADFTLKVTCRCANSRYLEPTKMSETLTFGELKSRLKCTKCGQTGSTQVEVVGKVRVLTQ